MDPAGSHEANRSVIAQANFRLSFGVLVAVTIACVHWFGASRPATGDGLVLGMLSGYIAYAALARWLAAHPQWLASRDLVVITAVIDPLILSAWMYFAGGSSMVFVAFYLFTTLGFGFRVGTMAMHICQAFSLFGFGVVVMTSPTWQGNLLFAASHALLLLVVPLYAASLVGRINAAREAAEFDSRAKSQLLAKVSHELRTPLTGIVADAQLLEVEAVDAGTVNRARSIQRLATTLDSEIKQLLDLSKIAVHGGDRSQVAETFSLAFTATQVIGSIRSIVGAKPLAVELDFDERIKLPVVGRHQELVSILTNLAGNAVKFTEQGSVTLEVRLLEATDTAYRIRFAVSDTGIGIDPAYHEKIFQPFFQVESGPARRYGGTGLGTTIAQTLARLMDGELGLDDNAGGGSHFWADIPFEVRAVEADPVHAGGAGNVVAFDDPFVRHRARVRSLRVLVADDQHANRRVLVRILEKAGHTVLTATNGDEALDRLEGGGVDLAILDMHMPQVSGIDVIKHLRFMQAGGPRTPSIVLSADATPQASEQATEAGARAFLTKPVAVARLLETIAETMKAQDPPVAQETRAVADLVQTGPAHSELLEELAEMGLGDDFLVSFVDQCLKDAASCVVNLGDTARQRNWGEFRDAAHALKGIVQNLGASGMAERCQQIMRAGDAFLVREHGRLVDELGTQLHVTVQQSKREVARILRTGPSGDAEHGGGPRPDAS